MVMADRGVPGDRIECEITEVKRNFAFGRLTRLLTPSSLRIAPRSVILISAAAVGNICHIANN